MSNQDPRDIIIRPVVTEKAMTMSQEANTYVFEVAQRASKLQIKDAISKIFNVRVEGVNTMVCRGKAPRSRFRRSKPRVWKKAIVTLNSEDSISII